MDVENGILHKNKRLSSSGDLIEWKGYDFLFLFDLIACTCGRASTFRVLSYTSSRYRLSDKPLSQCQVSTKTKIP